MNTIDFAILPYLEFQEKYGKKWGKWGKWLIITTTILLFGGKMIRVVISGTGRMGSTVYSAIASADDMEVVGVLDPIDINFNVPEEIASHNDAEQLFELVKCLVN